MNSWVISSNPATYDARRSLRQNGEVDWITKNDFAVNDTVYIYEVIPPKGRGGIVYETRVIQTNLSLEDKLDDRTFWPGQVYPKSITPQTKFSRLKLLKELNSDGLSLAALKAHGFTPPQGQAHLLDKKPALLSYIQNHLAGLLS